MGFLNNSKTKTLDTLIERNRKSIPKNIVNDIISVLASLFALFFSTSLVRELSGVISDSIALIIIQSFLVFVILVNEAKKVFELRRMFRGETYSKIIVGVTVVISFTVAMVGVNLWTDNTLKNTVTNDNKLTVNEVKINQTYINRIDSIQGMDISNNPEYIRLKKDMDYWKRRSAATTEERIELRNTIKSIQDEISQLSINFESNKKESINTIKALMEVELNNNLTIHKGESKLIKKNKFLSIFYSLLVFLAEIFIIILAKEHGNIEKRIDSRFNGDLVKKFQYEYKILTDVLSRKKLIDLDSVKYSPYLPDNLRKYMLLSKDDEEKLSDIEVISKNEAFKRVKDTYNLFIELDITTISNKQNLELCQEKLKEYYDRIINL